MQKKLNSAQAIVGSLVDHGVDCVFGIPGAHTYKLIDALYERRDRIRFIVTRHEQGAAYMAYGYAKSTGKIGVYTCVPGPGVLNTTAALCTAYAGNAPVLCLTSEIPVGGNRPWSRHSARAARSAEHAAIADQGGLRINHPTRSAPTSWPTPSTGCAAAGRARWWSSVRGTRSAMSALVDESWHRATRRRRRRRIRTPCGVPRNSLPRPSSR